VFQTFLYDGKPLALPGVSERDSMAYRLEALRVYLETVLGEDLFIEAYQHVMEETADDEESVDLKGKMGDKLKFVPLIYQLIVCEDSFYNMGWIA